MNGDEGGHRQRAVMASDAEWERAGRLARQHGMDRSRYLMHRALMPDAIPAEVLRRAVRELLVLSLLEEKRLREAGAGREWEDACDAVDDWIDRERTLGGVTDPGAANRWKALGGDLEGEDDPGTGPGQAEG
ncbi:MAG: hypothetical protein OXC28_06700 [Defluviicoccus sp.]|nr:hypothetical protein [Defluviicoccus sp.]